jgi:hypothetical protein
MKIANRHSEMPPPSLRPPTLMIDLLFGALMLFAFQMGDPSAQRIVPHDFEVPTSDGNAGNEPEPLLPLKPVRVQGDRWMYELPDGRRLGAAAVANTVKSRNKTPILLVARTASVQNYLDAEQPLRRLGLKVGLAVALEGETGK